MSSIGSTLNSINNSLLSEINPYLAAPKTKGNSASASSGVSATSSSDRVDLSKVSELFQDLQKLQTSNPAALKQVLQDAASKFKLAAQQQTDSSQSTFLSNLADRFQKAADTGDLSALQPPSSVGGTYSPHRHHGHHGGESSEAVSQPIQSGGNVQNLLATAPGGTTS